MFPVEKIVIVCLSTQKINLFFIPSDHKIIQGPLLYNTYLVFLKYFWKCLCTIIYLNKDIFKTKKVVFSVILYLLNLCKFLVYSVFVIILWRHRKQDFILYIYYSLWTLNFLVKIKAMLHPGVICTSSVIFIIILYCFIIIYIK